jgi:DNA-binding LacI/PurR family transcriptional regulator
MSHLRENRKVAFQSTLAFINPWSAPGHDLYHMELLLKGAVERAARYGYALEVLRLKEPGMTTRRFVNILDARGIKGLLIPPLPAGRGHLSLDWSRFSVVVMDNSMKPDLNRVTSDQFGNMVIALRRLHHLKYRRIGFVQSTFLDQKTDHAWYGAFAWYQQTIRETDRVPALVVPRIDGDALSRWFHKHQPEIIVGILHPELWKSSGLRVPQDVHHASMYVSLNGKAAGIDQNAPLIGSAAVDLLNSQLLRNETGVPEHYKQVLIRGEWVDGPTAPGP